MDAGKWVAELVGWFMRDRRRRRQHLRRRRLRADESEVYRKFHFGRVKFPATGVSRTFYSPPLPFFLFPSFIRDAFLPLLFFALGLFASSLSLSPFAKLSAHRLTTLVALKGVVNVFPCAISRPLSYVYVRRWQSKRGARTFGSLLMGRVNYDGYEREREREQVSHGAAGIVSDASLNTTRYIDRK